MSLERVFNALMSLGLSRREAEVYVYLATEGPREAGNIAENLRLSRQQLRSSLKSLQKREIVISTLGHSTQFKALPLRKTMVLLVKAKRTEAQHMDESREELLSEWYYMMRSDFAA